MLHLRRCPRCVIQGEGRRRRWPPIVEQLCVPIAIKQEFDCCLEIERQSAWPGDKATAIVGSRSISSQCAVEAIVSRRFCKNSARGDGTPPARDVGALLSGQQYHV
jgi:hypothetical protein